MALGPYPQPYDPETSPNGGISDTACINENFGFILTLVAPSSLSIGGNTLPVESIKIDPETSNLSAGVYIYTIHDGSRQVSGRMMVSK